MDERASRLEGRLGVLLDAAMGTVPHSIGASLVSVRCGRQFDGLPAAGLGLAGQIDGLQLRLRAGVLPLAATTGRPACSVDLSQDKRWPVLGTAIDLPRSLSAVCVPGVASLKTDLVLTAYAKDLNVHVLARATRDLVGLVGADTRHVVREVGGILAGRRHIEQAKGLVMALRRCGAGEAFALLRAASQRDQIKVQDLAIALLEFAGSQPPEPAMSALDVVQAPVPRPSDRARQAAAVFWRDYLEQQEKVIE